MIGLIVVEMRRALARRSTRALLSIALIGIVAIGVGVFLSARPTFDRAAAVAEAEAHRQQGVADCVASNGFGGEVKRRPGESLAQVCDAVVGSAANLVEDKRFHLTELWPGGGEEGILGITAVFLVIGALMGGATFIGGEWRWGTITTLLTWEPRRVRVFLAKAIAVAVLTVVISLVLQALVGAAVLPATQWRGVTTGADAEWFRGVLGVSLRGSALAAGAALLGYAVAFVGRNTAAALGLAFAYVSILEALVRGLKPAWQRWLVGDNGAVFLVGRQLRTAAFDRSVAEAALILAAYLVAVLAGAALVFSRRDVT